jgi:radical SAM-linked protein
LRLVSHHDLMHVFERMLRRAEVPVAHTQGFHPQPRMVFALSLALGIAGTREVLELELTEDLDPERLLARLARQSPPGLEILSARRLEGKSSPLVRRACYRLPLRPLAYPEAAAVPRSGFAAASDLPRRCTALLGQSHLWVQRNRPQPRKLDVRPYLSELSVQDDVLAMAVWVTPNGTARPEEIARLLGLEPLLEAGAYFERSDLEMTDEANAPVPDLHTTLEETPGDKEESVPQASEPSPAGPAARPTALVSGPLSFDS